MKNLLYLLLISCLLWAGLLWADDIEIVVSGSETTGVPYVHVVVDSSVTAFNVSCTYGPTGSCAPPFMTQAAYGNLLPGHSGGDPVSRIEVFSAILSALFQDSRFSQLHVSLLLSEDENSGKVLSGYRQLGADYDGESGAQVLKGLLTALLLSTTAESDSFQAKGAFYRWYRMLNDSSTDGTIFPDSEACSKLFSIIMATESTIEDGVLDLDILSELGMSASTGGGFTDLLTKMHDGSADLAPGGLAGINALEKTWVASPFMGVDLARDWARAGETGKPLNLDAPAQLQSGLENALLQALSISRTAVASAVSMTALGTAGPTTTDIFMPLYEPLPTLRWDGNIKKFKISTGQSSHLGLIVDAKGAQAIVATGSQKGQIAFNALSYWTEPGLLPSSTAAGIPFGVDGRVVARGGAGQKIPGLYPLDGFIVGDRNEETAARQLFLEPPLIVNGSENRFVPLNVDGIDESSTAALIKPLLNASSLIEAEQLIRWARGQDVDDEDGDGDVLEARSWLLGSAIHSRPVAVNYGAVAGFSKQNPNIRVYAGTGDGVFHAIENTTHTGEESGREVFGFYPNEGLWNITLLRENTISSLKMRYGVDGTAATLTVDNNHDGNLNSAHPENDEAYVYFGLRRGGYSYYALDVSNPAVTPTLKWKISRDSSAFFSEMGLGFSKPIVGKVNFRDESLDVVIFGGGYHGGWDASYTNRVGKDLNAEDDGNAEGSTGNAIYIVDARSGELVWKAIYGETTSTTTTSTNTRFQHAELVDSIPSSVSALKNSNGTIERLYVGDTGGSIWRVDLPVGIDPTNVNHRSERWFISKLADLGSDGETTDRRFFHAPDLFQSKENDGTAFDGLLISSGNRAKPNGVAVSNYHFYLKDTLTTSGDDFARLRAPITMEGGLSLADRSKCLSGGVQDTDTSCTLSMENGWMIKMERAGEKGLSSPVVDGGRVFFSSYVPAQSQACAVEPGEGYLYLVNLLDGSSVEPDARIHWLGKGIPQATIALGDHLLTPLGGIGEITQGECAGKLCKRLSSKLHKIYWREPGVDEF